MTLAEVERNPAFATLSSQDQALVRNMWFEKTVLPQLTEQQTDPGIVQDLYERTMDRAPVLQTQDETSSNLLNMTNQFRQAPQENRSQVLGEFFNRRFLEDFGLVGALSRIAYNHRDPDGGIAPSDDPITQSDRAKAYEFFMQTVRSDEATRGVAQFTDIAIPVAGAITDVLLTRGAAQVATRAMGIPKVGLLLAGKTNFSAQTPATTSRIAHWLQTRAIPQIANSLFDATTMTISGIMNENFLRDTMNQPRTGLSLQNVAMRFGTEFAMDYGVFMGIQFVAPLFRGARTAFGSLRDMAQGQTIAERALRAQDPQAAMRAVATGNFTDEMLSQLPADQRITAKFHRNLHNITLQLGMDADLADPALLLRSKGFELRPIKKGLEAGLDALDAKVKAFTQQIDEQLDAVRRATNMTPEIKQKTIEGIERIRTRQLSSLQVEQTQLLKGAKFELYDITSGTPQRVGSTFTNPDQALRYAALEFKPQTLVEPDKMGMSMNTVDIWNPDGTVKTSQNIIQVRAVKESSIIEELLSKRSKINTDIRTVLTMNNTYGLSAIADDVFSAGQLKKGLQKKTQLVSLAEFFNSKKGLTKEGLLMIPNEIPPQRAQEVLERFATNLRGASNLKDAMTKNLNSLIEAQIMGQKKRAISSAWVQAQAATEFPGSRVVFEPAGEVRVSRPGFEDLSFASTESFAQDLFERGVASGRIKGTSYLDAVQNHLKKNFGFDLKITGESDGLTRYVVQTSGKSPQIVANSSSLQEIFEVQPYLAPKLPAEFAPANVVSNTTAKAVDNTIVGNITDVLESLSKHEDFFTSNRKALMESVNGAPVQFDRTLKYYEVAVPEMNWVGRFESKKDLEQFVRAGYENSRSLTFLGSEKGAQVVWANDNWMIRTMDGKVQTARNLSELKQVVADLPANTKVGPDLLNLGPEFNEFLTEELADMRRVIDTSLSSWSMDSVDEFANQALRKAGFGKDSPGWLGWSMATRMRPEVIQDIATKTGNRATTGLFNNFENSRKTVRQKVQVAQKHLDGVWKGIPTAERVQLMPLMGYAPEQWATKWSALQEGVSKPMELSQKHISALMEHKQFVERTLRMDLGVTNFKFQSDYVPRIREYLLTNKDRLISESISAKDPQEYLSRVLGQQFGEANTKWFADNLRLEELAEFMASTDPIDLTMSYIRSGYKNRFMAPEFNKLLNNVKAADMRGEYKQYIFEYLNDAMGWSRDMFGEGVNMAYQGVQDFFKSLKQKGLVTGDMAGISRQSADFVSGIQNLTIGATMSFRAGLPLRNLHQVYTVGSLYMPIDAIQEGSIRANRLLKNPDEFIRKFVDTNILRPDMTPIGTHLNSQSKLGMLNKYGQRAYMNADTINRATMYMGVEAMWERANTKLAKLGADKMDFPRFMSWIEADLLGGADQAELIRLWRTQGEAVARNFHATRVVEKTQFTYDQMHNPRMLGRTTLGRMAGMFGHYPMSYAETLRQVFSQRSGATLARTVGRFAAVSTAIAAAHTKFGLDPTSYTPWGQMIFTGGPHFRYMMTLVDSLNMRSHEGQIARSKLARETTQLFVPGSALARSWGQAITLANEGDSYGAFIRIMSMPYAPTNK